MFEDLIATLDDLGVEYTEDYDNSVLEIDIADVDKNTLVSIITALQDAGETFDITEDTITVQGLTSEESEEAETGEDYMSNALEQYGGEDTGMGM